MAAHTLPPIGELIRRARRWHLEPAPVWFPGETTKMDAARRALQNITATSPPTALFEALRGLIPFDAGMLETIRVDQPWDPVDVLFDIPEGFVRARSSMIEQDPAVPLVLGIEAGVACVDREILSEREFSAMPYCQELYPRYGFVGVSGFMVTAEDEIIGRVHNTIWLFRGTRCRIPNFRECRMLEALHGEVSDAIAALRLPFLARHPLDFNALGSDSGYALLRRDGSIFEANLHAFSFANQYAVGGQRQHQQHELVEFIRSVERMSPGPARKLHVRRSDDKGILSVSFQCLTRGRYGLPEDLTLVRMSEVLLETIDRRGEQYLATLSPRKRHIARLLVQTPMSAKDIAVRLGVSHRTVEKHKEHIFQVLGVSSVEALGKLLRGSRTAP